ncbi:hypothetical protein AM595 [Anaplasma marginale str. St. Maries]|nr:hypothetical protein AM595 [Anaplasma marginale str. St. Maries]
MERTPDKREDGSSILPRPTVWLSSAAFLGRCGAVRRFSLEGGAASRRIERGGLHFCSCFFLLFGKNVHHELGVAEDSTSARIENQGRESRGESSIPVTRAHAYTSHKERVVVGCMVFLGIVLGSLLMHGAITSIQEGSTLFFIMNIGGFIGIIAIAALIWNSVVLARMRRRQAQSNLPASQDINLEAATTDSNEESPPTRIGSAELNDTMEAKMRE